MMKYSTLFSKIGLEDYTAHNDVLAEQIETLSKFNKIAEANGCAAHIELSEAKAVLKLNRDRLTRAKAALQKYQNGEAKHRNYASRWDLGLLNGWDKVTEQIDALELWREDVIEEYGPIAAQWLSEAADEETFGVDDEDEAEYQEALEKEAEEGGNPFIEAPSYYPTDLIPVWSDGYAANCFAQ